MAHVRGTARRPAVRAMGMDDRGRSVWRTAPLAALLLLAGCLPEKDLAVSGGPAVPGRYQATTSRPAEPVGEWPKVFGSAELVSLTRTAEAQNFDIAAATARIEQARAQAAVAASALYPQVSSAEDAARSLSPGTLRTKEPPFSSSAGNRFSLGLDASYVIDLFGRNKALAQSAEIAVEATRFDRDSLSVATVAGVTNLYLQILAAQDRRRFALENIRTAEEVLQAIRARVAVGTGTELDVAQQESVLASQKASIPALDQVIQQSRNLLGVLLGRAPESMRIQGGSLERLKVPRVRPGVPSQLLVRRPDIAAAEQRLAAQNASVDAARLAFLPTIALTGGASLESITLRNLLRPEALAASLAQGLTQPIFNGGNLRGQLELAKGHETELLQDYRKTVVTALSDVENALVAVQQTTAHERLQLDVVAAARRASQITQERLREGTIDVVTLLNTQLTLFQAQDQLTQVRLQKFQAYVSLFQALGGGWEHGLVIVAGPIPR